MRFLSSAIRLVSELAARSRSLSARSLRQCSTSSSCISFPVGSPTAARMSAIRPNKAVDSTLTALASTLDLMRLFAVIVSQLGCSAKESVRPSFGRWLPVPRPNPGVGLAFFGRLRLCGAASAWGGPRDRQTGNFCCAAWTQRCVAARFGRTLEPADIYGRLSSFVCGVKVSGIFGANFAKLGLGTLESSARCQSVKDSFPPAGVGCQ